MPFLGVDARPGEIARKRIPVAELGDGTPLTLPVVVARGRRDGPTFYVQAGLHGDELTGIEICRLALAELDPTKLRGTVVSVPLANPAAHLTRTRGYLHEERWLIDINRIFPGDRHGLLTERLAAIIFEDFVMHADLALDLHSALDGCEIAPFVYIDPDDDEHGTLAMREKHGRAFGTPYAYYKPRGTKLGTSDVTRSIRSQEDRHGKPGFTAEMGESRRVSYDVVPIGVRGVRNVLRSLGMMEGEPEMPPQQRVFTTITLAHAQHGGGLRMKVKLGDEVRAGQPIAEVVDVFGQQVEVVESPTDGFVLRRMLLGSISTGAEVAWVGA